MGQDIERNFHGLPTGDFWVFGYGSLMWNPGFTFKEKQNATLPGFKRSLCVWSWHHRGSKNRPGLVFGLDRIGSGEVCQGCAYQVAAEHREDTLLYLKERELITGIYQAATLPVSIKGRQELALTFIVDPSNEQYAGQMDPAKCANIIDNAQGRSGPNTEYVLETFRYLQEKNIQDKHLQQIAKFLG